MTRSSSVGVMALRLGVLLALALGVGCPRVATASVVTITPSPIAIAAPPGKSASVTVNVRNSGSDPIEAIKPEIQGAAFTLANVGCRGSLAPQESCSVTVAYRAPSSGKAAGEFVLRAGSGIAATTGITGYRPCRVPRLTGVTLAVAKTRLRAAGCQLGKVSRPAGPTPRGSRLVVWSSDPRAGATMACGSVKLTLKRVRKPRSAARAAPPPTAHVAEAPPTWRISTDALMFTAEAQGEASKEFQVFNDGPGDLVGLFLEQDPANNRFQRENGCPSTLAAGASCTIKVIYFAGSDAATDRSTLLVKAQNDPNGTKAVALTATTKAAEVVDDDDGCS